MEKETLICQRIFIVRSPISNKNPLKALSLNDGDIDRVFIVFHAKFFHEIV